MTSKIRFAGWLVAVCAAIATVHGLHAVATGAGLGPTIATLFPVMTDGLALVAYAATRVLPTRAGRGYAWSVVLVAAALSGAAQAVYLYGGGVTVPPWLAAGVGAWPAVAATVTAHLLHLLHRSDTATAEQSPRDVPMSETFGHEPAPLVAPPPDPPGLSPIPRDGREADLAPKPQRDTPDESNAGDSGAPELQELEQAPVRLHLAQTRQRTVAEIVADGGGRGTVAKELGVSPTEARRLIDEHKAAAG